MSRYSIRWALDARDALAEVWLAAADRNLITKTVYDIELLLRDHGPLAGELLAEGLYRLHTKPLVVYYTARELDLMIEIDAVGLLPD